MKVFVPVPAVSEANRSGEHWTKKKRRHDTQKEHTFAAIRVRPLAERLWTSTLRAWTVRFVVHYSGRPMDSDNLAGSVKYYRDEVARFLGVDDGDVDRVQFSVSQTPVPRRHRGVEITIEPWEKSDERQIRA